MSTSNWVVGFSSFTSIGDTLRAELWAILLGLKLASQLPHISKIVVETDSSQAVDLVLHITSDFHPLGTIIEKCRFLLSKFKDYMIFKVGRHQNRCVDILAKEGRKKKLPLIIYDEAPDFILDQYHEDRTFSSFSRLFS